MSAPSDELTSTRINKIANTKRRFQRLWGAGLRGSKGVGGAVADDDGEAVPDAFAGADGGTVRGGVCTNSINGGIGVEGFFTVRSAASSACVMNCVSVPRELNGLRMVPASSVMGEVSMPFSLETAALSRGMAACGLDRAI